MYAIVDIETTGGDFRYGKITEIAIYLHDGNKIIDEFVSLINPEQLIPQYITQLTGITNSMVEGAPKFYEVARRIVEITDGAIFVAHNVTFDYRFIQEEFKALAYKYDRETLCTVKLARKILPGYKSYSLGNICNEFGIGNDARHRAAGDAFATVQLFEIMLKKRNGILLPFNNNESFSTQGIHPELKIEVIKGLPQTVGVYYFYNESNELIYIGKSRNIRNRVISHLGNTKTRKAVKMKSEIAHVSYEETGSELVALLKESDEIKKEKPIYNVAQVKKRSKYGIFSFKARNGYVRFNIGVNNGRSNPLILFNSEKEAKEFLLKRCEELNLCQKLCELSDSDGACFQYHIKICLGACLENEDAESYNVRAQKIIDYFILKPDDFIIVDDGRYPEENAVVLIENGKYVGYGWLDNDIGISTLEEIKSSVILCEDNYDARMIIKKQLTENKHLKKVNLAQ